MTPLSRFFLPLLLVACYGGDPYSLEARRDEYGQSWPLTVERARIGCDLGDVAYLMIDGTKYALNARALEAGLPRPDQFVRPESGTADFMERVEPLCRTRAQVNVDPRSKSGFDPPRQ